MVFRITAESRKQAVSDRVRKMVRPRKTIPKPPSCVNRKWPTTLEEKGVSTNRHDLRKDVGLMECMAGRRKPLDGTAAHNPKKHLYI
ncbi:MAG: hypothetical protein NWQ21_09355, partial [Desulfobacterales bacterium]|nr:hypothetical protein [Desulfobacterales bacterium]